MENDQNQEELKESVVEPVVEETPETPQTNEEAAETVETQEKKSTSEAEIVAEESATPQPELKESVSEEVTSSEEEQPANKEAETTEAKDEAPQVVENPEMAFLMDIISDDTKFEEALNAADVKEVVLLMESFAKLDDVGAAIPKSSNIKRKFDALSSAEDSEVDGQLNSRFNTAFAKFNKKRSEYNLLQEKNKEANSARKQELLNQLKEIVETEQVTAIDQVRTIQEEWKQIGWVLQKDIVPFNTTYKHYLDVYYTLRSHYNELKDIDRKHNQEEKEKLIAEILSLIPQEGNVSRESWKASSEKVKNLQEIWRTVGHVPRENIEKVNEAYKGALDQFYSKRQAYYDVQDELKKANVPLKEAIIEKLQPFAAYNSGSAKEWNEATRKVLALQEEWKQLGPAPFDVNKDLWKSYRALCDQFFEKKSTFFKSFDEKRAENLKKKAALCEEAEAIQDSDDWDNVAKKLKELQAEWRKIGPVHERHSQKVWKRFRSACDHFFSKRDEAKGVSSGDYQENLKKKEEVLSALNELLKQEALEPEIDKFRELQNKWKSIGHVPIKEKNKINKAYKTASDKFFDRLKKELNTGYINLDRLSGRGQGGGNRGNRQGGGATGKLRRQIGQLREKIENYETNILYVSKGKSGDSLRKMIQGQIDEAKAELESLKAKLKQLTEKKEEAPKKEQAEPAEENQKAQETAAETEDK